MNIKEPVVLSWSGGKDSSLALHYMLEQGVEVKYLLTTLSSENQRISMHGVREDLLDRQSVACGIPLIKMWVGEKSNIAYEKAMGDKLKELKNKGINIVVFGDIFLEDLREYRESRIKKAGMKAVFPLWKKNTNELMNEFLHLGFKTITCCVTDKLGEKRVGKVIDRAFLSELPEGVDPCGENGEFHTFCYKGPVFKKEIPLKKGEVIYKGLPLKLKGKSFNDVKGFWFCDLKLA